MIKLAISNPSQHLIDILMDVLPYNIIWVAYDSSETIRKAKKDPPDLIILDVQIPGTGALDITEKLINEFKCSIIITTSDIGMNSSDIFEIMGKGALDVISLKRYRFDEDPLLVNHLLKKIQTIENLIGKTPRKNVKNTKEHLIPSNIHKNTIPIVAMGASTGGPIAISKIISSFPANVYFSVVIIQHIDQLFIPSLVAWLNDYSKLPVEIAEEGEYLKPGTIYLAGRNEHLVINAEQQFEYSKTMTDNNFYSPSINIFFESLANNCKNPAIAVLLTGMGNDGAKGLKKLYDKKWFTIVQDEASCTVFGMPKMAILTGAACDILSIDKIGPKILKLIN